MPESTRELRVMTEAMKLFHDETKFETLTQAAAKHNVNYHRMRRMALRGDVPAVHFGRETRVWIDDAETA